MNPWMSKRRHETEKKSLIFSGFPSLFQDQSSQKKKHTFLWIYYRFISQKYEVFGENFGEKFESERS